MILNEFFNLPQVFEKDMEEGIFDKKKPAEPFEFYLDGCDPHAVKKYLLNKFGSQGWRVAGPGVGASRVFVAMSPELYPTGNEAKWDIEANCGEQGVAEGEVTKTATGLKHRATDKYGAGNDEPHHYTGGRSGFSDPGKYARDLEHVNKQLVKDLDASMGISWKNRGTKGVEVDEAEQQKGADYRDPPEANYDDKYQAMVKRVGEKARAQEKAKQQPKAPVRESRLALLKQIIQS